MVKTCGHHEDEVLKTADEVKNNHGEEATMPVVVGICSSTMVVKVKEEEEMTKVVEVTYNSKEEVEMGTEAEGTYSDKEMTEMVMEEEEICSSREEVAMVMVEEGMYSGMVVVVVEMVTVAVEIYDCM